MELKYNASIYLVNLFQLQLIKTIRINFFLLVYCEVSLENQVQWKHETSRRATKKMNKWMWIELFDRIESMGRACQISYHIFNLSLIRRNQLTHCMQHRHWLLMIFKWRLTRALLMCIELIEEFYLECTKTSAKILHTSADVRVVIWRAVMYTLHTHNTYVSIRSRSMPLTDLIRS